MTIDNFAMRGVGELRIEKTLCVHRVSSIINYQLSIIAMRGVGELRIEKTLCVHRVSSIINYQLSIINCQLTNVVN